MIEKLTIKNFSLVKDIEINFSSGLNVIHGESGSGKSLILQALTILSGASASPSLIRVGEDKAILEATISGVGVIQKIITKSRSSQNIDGENITLSHLREVVGRMIKNHSQGGQEEIYTKEFQLNFLDRFVPMDILNDTKVKWEDLKKKDKDLEDLISSKQGEPREFLEFLKNEIEAVNPSDNEDVRLEENLKQSTTKSKSLKTLMDCLKSIQVVGGHIYIIEALQEVIGKTYPDMEKYNWEGTNNQLESLGQFLDYKISGTPTYSDEEVDQINSRIYALQKLKKKLGLPDLSRVTEKHFEIVTKLEKYDSYEEEVKRLKQERSKCLDSYIQSANLLSMTRSKAWSGICIKLQTELKKLGFSYIDLRSKLTILKEEKYYSARGIDDFEILISFNKGFDPQEMRKIVSGGEASRLSLAMKVVSHIDENSVYILDEVDTGLSKNSLLSMIGMLKGIPNQIICVSHSDELIKNADNRIEVYKEIENDKTETKVR